MLFAVGTKVRFRYTGETGTITALLEEGMLQVRLDSDPDFEIPAFEEDLLRNDASEPNSAGARFVQGKAERQPEAPPRRQIKSQYHILKPKGLQLLFEPMPGKDGNVSRYKVWLLNDTLHEFIFEFDLFTHDRDVLTLDDKIAGATVVELGDFRSDDLNASPEVRISAQRITTEGLSEPMKNTLKIRAKQFFNSLQTAPILNVLAYQTVLLDKFEASSPTSHEKNTGGDLRDFAKQHARERNKVVTNAASQIYRAFNPEEFASFVPEIDLHIQNLMDGYARLDKSEILRIQLLHFQRFLDKAVRLGVPRVFVIHGVGEGKLRDAIAERLRAHPSVEKFKNEYHHKYGYGATEVIF
jgi:hypothetical protein